MRGEERCGRPVRGWSYVLLMATLRERLNQLASIQSINDHFVSGENDWPPPSVAKLWEKIDDEWGPLLYGDREKLMLMAGWRGLRGTAPYVPVKTGALIATKWSEFLFGEMPIITPKNEANLENLQRILKHNALYPAAQSAAVACSGLGSTYQVQGVDASIPSGRLAPLIYYVSARRVIPRFRHNRLIGGTIVTETKKSDSEIWRRLESHAYGVIGTRLFKGNARKLGQEFLPGSEEWATYVGNDIKPEQATGIEDRLTMQYIPNYTVDESPWGYSDFAGDEETILGVNEAASSELDFVKKMGLKTVMDESLRTENSPLAYRADLDIIWADLQSGVGGDGDKLFHTIQPEGDNIATDVREKLFELALLEASLTATAIGKGEDGGAISGTALRMKMASTLTRATAKSQYWQAALAEGLYVTALLDSRKIGDKPANSWVGLDAEEFTVELQDGLPFDFLEEVNAAGTAVERGLMSRLTALQRVHPGKTSKWYEEELKRIDEDQEARDEFAKALRAAVSTDAPDLEGEAGADV